MARRVQSSFVVEGILHLVADVEPCLWFAAPIMKALMADSMVGILRGEGCWGLFLSVVCQAADDLATRSCTSYIACYIGIIVIVLL